MVLDDRVNMVSRVPSVKYRGFFINDEWPAFGSWAKTHFGSMNAACYAPVFELLLRMKGNYRSVPWLDDKTRGLSAVR